MTVVVDLSLNPKKYLVVLTICRHFSLEFNVLLLVDSGQLLLGLLLFTAQSYPHDTFVPFKLNFLC